jgi:hypothetical protein
VQVTHSSQQPQAQLAELRIRGAQQQNAKAFHERIVKRLNPLHWTSISLKL